MKLVRLHNSPTGRPHARRGTALVEALFLLSVLIVIFGVAFHIGPMMNARADITIENRFNIWRRPAQWHHHWDVDNDRSWVAYDADANGPIPSPAVPESQFAQGETKRPRGDGEALENLYAQIGNGVMNASGDPYAQDFLCRLWNNLPGRKERTDTRYYQFTEAWEATRKLRGVIYAHYELDTAPWVHSQMPAWLIAQHGPMSEINEIFHRQLDTVPPEFKRMAREVLHAWFEEEYMYNWSHPSAPQP